MKTSMKQKIKILLILLLSCSFIFLTACSALRDWWGHDPSSSHFSKHNDGFANNDLNQFYYSVRPVNGNVESDYRLARYFQKRGKHNLAVDELLKAIRKDPSFIKAYNALGVSYDHLGNFDLAIKSYKFALQINPELDYVYNNLGYSYLLSGDLNSAIDAFQKAIALDNTNKRYHNNLGLAYARNGQTDRAFDEFKLAGKEPDTQFTKETKVETLPESITPYNDIPKDPVSSLLLAEKLQPASEIKSGYSLIPDDLNETDLAQKPVQNELAQKDLESSSKNLLQENAADTKDPVTFTVQVSASNSLKDSTLLMEMLTKKGYPCPYLNKVENEMPYYRLRLGSFNNKKDADQWLSSLTRTLGYKPFIAVEDTYSEKITTEQQNCFDAATISTPALQPFYIEISNGNGVRHMAKNVRTYLNLKGFNADRLSNADHFNYPKTKIYYQEGYQQDALRLAKEIPGRQKTADVIERNQMMRREIKVLIGKDLVPFQEHIRSSLEQHNSLRS